ncbi:MAG: hypothetical protein QM755_09280 [Luteolibacter sp.]
MNPAPFFDALKGGTREAFTSHLPMPKIISNSFRVRRGNEHITVSPFQTPAGKDAWRLRYQPTVGVGKPWQVLQFDTKARARTKAEEILDERATGLIWTALPSLRRQWLERVHAECQGEENERAVLEFLASRKRSQDIGSAVAAFIAHKQAEAGEETPHLRQVRKFLDELVEGFAGRQVTDIHFPDLQEWWGKRVEPLGWKRRNDLRTFLVMFWSWCQKQQLAPQDKFHVAHRLPTSGSVYSEPEIYTPEEFLKLAAAVDLIDRPNIVLGAFGGFRPEECSPPAAKSGKKATKRGLVGEDIDWKFRTIYVRPQVSKGGRKPRRVPMTDTLIEWLEWAGITEGFTGPLCARNMTDVGESTRLGKQLFGEWKQDALRHSYASYRNSTLRNKAKVSEEMGTSEKMFDRNYHHPLPEEHGRKWFGMKPSDLPVHARRSVAGATIRYDKIDVQAASGSDAAAASA